MDNMFSDTNYPTLSEIVSAIAPQEGMHFETDDVAFYLFAVYARRMGFAIKKDTSYRSRKTGEVNKRLFVCNKQRHNTADDNPTKQRKTNFIQRTNCQVRMLVKRESGQWYASLVHLDHNHDLMPSEWLVRFMRCHKNISESDKKFIEILQKSRVPPRKVMTIFRSLIGSFRNIGFDETDIGNMRSAEREKHKNRDIRDLLEMFTKEQVKTPGFYYSMQVDENVTVRSVFWTDLMGRNNYHLFGDYISFDTTFSTNRYNMPFAPIVGVNNHGNTVLFGCALLQNQKTSTFKWLLGAFLDAMGGKMPINIITDQDKAMWKAIAAVFPDATHRFCY